MFVEKQREKEKKNLLRDPSPLAIPRRYLESRGYLATKLLACGMKPILITIYSHPKAWTNKLKITGF